jgi:hypothetical protein
MMKIISSCAVALLVVMTSSATYADATEQEAIQAQTASAMASAAYAAKKCPNLRVDQAKIDSLVARSGKTAEQLIASEEYIDQRDVILSMEKGKQGAMICLVLHRAHGGYGRGVITEK